MSRPDTDDVVLQSLREGRAVDAEDLRRWGVEEAQARDLLRTATALRTLRGQDRDHGLEHPSGSVWTAIQGEIRADRSPSSEPGSTKDAPAAVQDEAAPLAEVVELQSWRKRASLLAVAAGVMGMAVGVIGTTALTSDAPETAPVAQTELEPLPDWDGAGSASLAETDDGGYVITVEVAASPKDSQEQGYQEVWLIDEDVEGMVSLGVLEGPSGSFAVPDGVAVEDFPIVDVSLEPVDGQPTHSGNSIVRGILPA